MKKKIHSTKKEKKNLALPLFIIFIMVLSGAGYFFGGDNEESNLPTITYKDLEFSKTMYGYRTEINNQEVIIVSNPLNLSNYPSLPGNIYLTTLNSADKIYLSIDPSEDLAPSLRSLSNLPLTPRVFTATYDENLSIEKDLPFKTCEDATPENKVIIIKNQEPTLITYKFNCLTLQGKDLNLTKLTDKFVIDLLTK